MAKELYSLTGNPFVDAGIWSISSWVQKIPRNLDLDDLRSISEDIVPLYLTKPWRKVLYSIFPNNKITNPSIKEKDKEKEYQKFLDTLINEIKPMKDSGDCLACGRRDKKELRTRTDIPLLGSGKFINYFPHGQSGADFCSACTFAVQFSPLYMYLCIKYLLVHSNSEKIMSYWSNTAIQNIRQQILTGNYTKCFDEGYKNPLNALFHIIQDLILSYDEVWHEDSPSIIIYHFTNYLQEPDLEVYRFPTSVFRFLAYVRHHEKFSDWTKIIRKGYINVNWSKIKSDKDYKNKVNSVYNKLMRGQSIIRHFIDTKTRSAIGDWELLSFYLKEVQKMEKKRLTTLKRVGDELSYYIKETKKIKRLVKLEQAKNYNSFRNVLRIIIKDRISLGLEQPLFSLEDYVEDLFPEGALGWRETQDLLLFRIYENLHQWLIDEKEISEEIIFAEETIEIEEGEL